MEAGCSKHSAQEQTTHFRHASGKPLKKDDKDLRDKPDKTLGFKLKHSIICTNDITT